MSAFADSQTSDMADTVDHHDDDAQSGSQDLFNDDDHQQPASPVNNQCLNRILAQLEQIASDVAEIKKNLKIDGKSFDVENCSFKKRFHQYLRAKFSTHPWLNIDGDEEFKREVHKQLRNEGFARDGDAFKKVVSFSSKRFCEFRNQLRRTILMDRDEPLKGLTLQEFCRVTLGNYCRFGEEVVTPTRMHLAVVLRSFMRKSESSSNNCFWKDFKTYFEEVEADTREDKWAKLNELDEKRVKRFLQTREQDEHRD